jgi:hypothetical protein
MIRIPAARNVGNWLHQSLTCSYEVRNGDSPPPQETYRSADSAAERTTKESRSDAQSKGEEKKRNRILNRSGQEGTRTYHSQTKRGFLVKLGRIANAWRRGEKRLRRGRGRQRERRRREHRTQRPHLSAPIYVWGLLRPCQASDLDPMTDKG